MVKVEIISGPRAGQENLVEMVPRDLAVPAREGWRWEVDWSTVPRDDLFEWSRQDMINKVASCAVGGREVVLRLEGEEDQKWSGNFSKKIAGEIEDAIVNSGCNLFVAEDSEESLVILGEIPRNIAFN